MKRFLKYFKYLLTAKSVNNIHSPFIFDLYTNLILDETPFYAFDKIEDLRLVLENDFRTISVTDFGAITKNQKLKTQKRKIKSIAKKSATSAKNGQLLFRLVNKFQPKIILELGTSLGLGTLYLASPDSRASVFTMEGSTEISKIAKWNFDKLKFNNIQQFVGNFDEMLPGVLQKLSKIDFVFFDGNHRKEPTLNYFMLCLEKSHNESIFVFDDIHWSDEMEQAWNEIKKNERVKATIDLFFFGIVFFRKELTKQDFVLRF